MRGSRLPRKSPISASPRSTAAEYTNFKSTRERASRLLRRIRNRTRSEGRTPRIEAMICGSCCSDRSTGRLMLLTRSVMTPIYMSVRMIAIALGELTTPRLSIRAVETVRQGLSRSPFRGVPFRGREKLECRLQPADFRARLKPELSRYRRIQIPRESGNQYVAAA